MTKNRAARTLILLAILAGSGSVMKAAPGPTAADTAAVKTALDNTTKTCAQATDLCTIVPPTTVKVALACRPALINLMGKVGRADFGASTVAQVLTRLHGMRAVCQVAVNTVMEVKTTAALASAAATELQAEARDEAKADADAKAAVAKINAEAEEAQKTDED